MTAELTNSKWAAFGAAVAVSLGAGGIGLVSATSPADAVTYVPITPCRVADTRPEPAFNTGPRNTPIGQNETHTITAHGDSGDCTGTPTTATGVQLNVTALNASTGTFLTIWGDGAQPDASSLNPGPGQPPAPNAVTTGLTATGVFNIYNAFGTVDVIVDIVGYYTDHDHDHRYYTKTEIDSMQEVGPFTGDDIVDGSLTGADVGDDSIASADLSNEPGVVVNYLDGSVNATSTPTAIVSTSIRVPSDGFVDVEVTGQWAAQTSANYDEAYCQFQNGAPVGIDQTQPWFRLFDRGVSTGFSAFSGHRVMEIAAADNPPSITNGQLLSLVCDETFGDVQFLDLHISATFVPSSYAP